MATVKNIQYSIRPYVIVVNSPLFREVNDRYDEDSLPPIGLGLIATSLKNVATQVQLIDAVALNIPLAQLIKEVNQKSPDFVCLNVFSTNLILVKEFVQSLKSSIHVILGGLSTKDLREEIFSWNLKISIDVVHGDGEKIVPAIVNDSLEQVPVIMEGRKRYFQIDKQSPYYVDDISLEELDRNFFVNEPVVHPFGFTEAAIITSRGCIYNCAFCAAARSLNKQMGVREKSTESVIAEINNIVDIYPDIDSIRVLDDLFLKTPHSIDKAIEIFSEFDLQWRAMAHVETFNKIDDLTAQKLKLSGCKELFIGIESGSPEILKSIHKCHKLDKIKYSVELLLRNGIDVKGYFILGFPGETIIDFQMTFDLAQHLSEYGKKYNSVFRTSVFQYRPYHGTELYHKIEEYQKSDVKDIDYIKPNEDLSEMVGRLQFNFHNGNHSAEPISVVQEYILKVTNLNSFRIFGQYGKSSKRIKSYRKVQRLSAS